nr:hypothetical protein [uncultured Flavobacterium sp.]
MGKKGNPIPPIRRNPRLGKEKSTDASIAWGGSKLLTAKNTNGKEPVLVEDKVSKKPERAEEPVAVKKKRGRKRKNVKNFVINDVELLVRLSKRLGISLSAVVNLGLRYVQKEFP